MRASPDGYTLIMGHMGTHAASAGLYPKLAYEKQNELLQSIVGDAAVYLRREAVLLQRWINCLAKKAIIAGRPSQRGAQNSG